MSRIAGTYRINTTEFPVPITSWEAQVIGGKLDGLPALNSYYLHVWSWPGGFLDPCAMELLLDLFYQQDASGQLSVLETDPHDAGQIPATGPDVPDVYSTMEYTDFVIKEVSPRTRGLPHYDNPRVIFEVYTG